MIGLLAHRSTAAGARPASARPIPIRTVPRAALEALVASGAVVAPTGK